ncbi:hypothetical protein KCP76_00905 [Salmonella enterica subsp. enterica serovar Weltevreden]|nr:hypothetical protein KCP76_00905 [Salmonella enterica subsp. enterica serovar Weltevreden]
MPLPAQVLAKVLARGDRPAADYALLAGGALSVGMDVYGWKIMALTLLPRHAGAGFLAAPASR